MRNYIKYILTSTNEHGVHSPFVFKLVTECIYRKKTIQIASTFKNSTSSLNKKYVLLIARLIPYLNIHNILDLGKDSFFNELASQHLKISKNTTVSETYDLIYTDVNFFQSNPDTFSHLFNHIHNDSLWIVAKNQTSKGLKGWEEIKQHDQVKVTVDLFGLGLVFFRREQVKQHFIIRF